MQDRAQAQFYTPEAAMPGAGNDVTTNPDAHSSPTRPRAAAGRVDD